MKLIVYSKYFFLLKYCDIYNNIITALYIFCKVILILILYIIINLVLYTFNLNYFVYFTALCLTNVSPIERMYYNSRILIYYFIFYSLLTFKIFYFKSSLDILLTFAKFHFSHFLCSKNLLLLIYLQLFIFGTNSSSSVSYYLIMAFFFFIFKLMLSLWYNYKNVQ